jgi:lipopolysaccharide export system protein LptA
MVLRRVPIRENFVAIVEDVNLLIRSVDQRLGVLRALLLRGVVRVAALLVSFCLVASSAVLQAEVELPPPDENETISFSADRSNRWEQGQYEVWLLDGNVTLMQGVTSARSDQAVLWVKRSGDFGDRKNTVIAYLEGDVRITYQRAGFPYQLSDKSWFGQFDSSAPIDVRARNPQPEPQIKPPVFRNAIARRDPFAAQPIQRTQVSQFDGGPPQADPLPPGSRRLRVFPRSSVKVQAQWFPNPAGNEWIAVISTPVNLIIDGMADTGSLDVSTDRMVLWTRGTQPDLSGQTVQGNETPLEIYMEGNIVFRQGDRLIQAQRMYFDVNNDLGTVLQAEVLTPVPSFRGLLRLKADVVQQTGKDTFFARDAFLTSSRFESPGYRLQTKEVNLEDVQKPVTDFMGNPQIDPETGEQEVLHQQLATSRNNLLFLGPVPVFYWPKMVTDLSQPSYYLRRVQFKQDKIFGTQGKIWLDTYQLLGIRRKPGGTDWTVNFDYLSLRGPAAGTFFRYTRDELFGIPGAASGVIDAWGVHDTGVDQLGGGRSGLTPEKTERYRILARHRQYLPGGYRLTGEFGKISDRNFLEEYYLGEWQQLKDQSTDVEIKKLVDSMSFSGFASVRLNNFFTETQWLPKLDHYWLGKSLLNDKLTYYSHTSAGYAQYQVFNPPPSATQAALQPLLPWEVGGNRQGQVLTTSQEIDMPVDLGPVKVVPYAMGNLSNYGQDLTGQDFDQAFGQLGVRGSIPFWTSTPNVESTLFNLHGMSHKVVLEGDLSYANAQNNYLNLPLYNPLDDNAQEYFRRNFMVNTFGGLTPFQFDPRSYALRSGLAGSVTNPTPEIAGELAAFRFGARQRLQTKRGPIEKRRIVDWMTLDTEAVLFPDPNRDNFGKSIGLAQYDYRWHVGDRLTLLSNGSFDFFNQGQKIYSVVAQLSRPPRGSFYVGYYSLGGPIQYQILSTFYTYRLSPKWISATALTFDLRGLGLVGNQVALTRVGESFLTSFNFTVDKYRNNVGINLSIEPRFLTRTRLGNVGGAQIPLAGYNGLE